MDQLALARVPFFFMFDFLMQQSIVCPEDSLEEKGLFIDFPNFTNTKTKDTSSKKTLEIKAFPEDLAAYQKGFEIVQNHLKQGNSYLVNYTRKTPIELNLSLEEIHLRAKAKYKIYYKDRFVCFSPETFVEINNDVISTHPMKGTIDAAKPDAAQQLKNNPKEKAEHYTVVDLLRNDLSTVADHVQVVDFQRIDYLETNRKNLFAMSSEIKGVIKPEYQNKIGSLMRNLLPAGSILGAPKPKTLQIVLEAEKYNRGWYSGVSGWFDGKNLDSCVMIRFIEKENNRFFFKSGGGLTHQSQLQEEYEEMKNKIYVPVY
ncbi:aminodeoxychorismate synthase component I [Bergeyella sp. RCAD1439]|uniref:aminodeoxychorismate synthase component I n=1 Tax=Bergeyella anatis TaxID=3113737 RepID=UPI002E18FE04|nr:aminodeoxychorismate synthase component I [Bergeyella sp. RCAD1439]